MNIFSWIIPREFQGPRLQDAGIGVGVGYTFHKKMLQIDLRAFSFFFLHFVLFFTPCGEL
jgi:hypothetical protein